jgi:hypothetical protein
LRALIRSGQIIAGVVASLALVACGSSGNQASHEPKGNFKVAVASATFPASQRLAQKTHLVIAVRNTGTKAIPNLAVTICNVTCAYPAPAGEGTSAGAFAQDLQMQGLANASRPVWVVDRPPGACNYGCKANSPGGEGGPGGAVTAYSNTWALGALSPGRTARFDWAVTAVAPGRHVVAWEVAAGLNGKAKAVLSNGSAPHGTFTVNISNAPAQTYVNNSGQIVTTPANNP